MVLRNKVVMVQGGGCDWACYIYADGRVEGST